MIIAVFSILSNLLLSAASSLALLFGSLLFNLGLFDLGSTLVEELGILPILLVLNTATDFVPVLPVKD